MNIFRPIGSNGKIYSALGILVCIVLLSFFSTAFAETITYTYDNTGELNTVVSDRGATVQYTYDNSSNRLSQTISPAQSFFTITASSDANGSVTPAGVTTANYGGSQTYTIIPSTGYSVSGVLVDGTSVGAVSTYTFSSVAANHTISATFTINTYTVTPSAGSGGSLSPSTAQTVNYNATTSFTVTPNTGYNIASVTGCGGTLAGNIYTTGPITGNCIVSATFAIATYTITASSGANGSVAPAGVTTVNYGGSQTYTITPTSGYSVSSVLVDGTSMGAVGTYTFSSVTANHTITATFAINTYTVTPTALSFGSQLVGTTSAASTVTLKNTGASSLTINSISASGANASEFTVGSGCGSSLAKGSSCTISVKFSPTATGVQTASLVINTSNNTGLATVSLSGTGVEPVASVSPTALMFSSPLNVQTTPQTVTVSNTGTASMQINSIALGGTSSGQFSETTNCGTTLAAGSSCNITVTFKPTSTGSKSASLNVTVAAPGTSQSVTLSGTVLVPILTLLPTSLSFDNQSIHTTSAPKTVTVSNTGTASMQINSIALGGTSSGQFSETTNCGTTLAAGSSCNITVTFKPTSTGSKSASVNVTVAVPGTSQSVTLSGTGQ